MGADNDWRAAAKKEAASINSVGLYTNLTGALEKAAWQIEENSPYQQSIILLTDGKIDMPPVAGQSVNAQERTRLFADILPAYRNAGAKIHTLALSEKRTKEATIKKDKHKLTYKTEPNDLITPSKRSLLI